MADNWLPPHARIRVSPRKERAGVFAEWIAHCRKVAVETRMLLHEIFREPRPDSGEWDSGARGL